ncbi:hypothetical protein SDRG_00382 [Saprolegnia diclina VS20]|uniref:Uncharacterized protein n=1 Tax=Saprolegnia diclina (strain VS20) TaxID=1156394 RepID=T0QWP4_SAPDV|nr:hypothetical protein SDRG_00382 [Saprolegnia diclina VS20]EQC42654.1 hypothetical protein SDRG_00382 [Saprolegnia diclina VS20]|eukprot:XP_008604077.1 hypothetical protein SDRG_00382 [Saprolegnia diclina VS20]
MASPSKQHTEVAHLEALRRNIAQLKAERTQLCDDLRSAQCDARALTEELERKKQPTLNKYVRLAVVLGIDMPEVDLVAACERDVAALCTRHQPGFGATEDLWLVDATNSSTVSPLGRAAAATLPARSTVTARDVLRLGCSYAARGLPVATINAILDRLTLYHEVETTRTLNVSAPANVQYLQLTVPALEHPAITRTQCVALVIECDSHDQGWATDASHLNGSYRGCHSWVELQVTAPNGSVVVPRRDAYRNLRAHSAFRRHLVHITDTSVLAHLTAPGSRVTVHLRAQFPGWRNEARFARLAIAYKVALCDDLMQL